MKTPLFASAPVIVLIALSAPLCPSASAQEQTPPPSASAPASTGPMPTPAQVKGGTGGAKPTDAGEVVQLSPFEVSTTTDKGYTALNTNSITRFNTELNKLPVQADIFDSQFMSDIAAQNVEDMIVAYSAGAGLSSPQAASSAAQSQPGDSSGAYITIRGLFAPSEQRDGFMPNSATDSAYTRTFDVESVQVVKGPQALLYGGGGGAGGVVNIVSKQARFGARPRAGLSYYVDQYGTKFANLDYGMGTDHFAVRLDLNAGTQKYNRVYLGGPLNGQYLQVAFRTGGLTVRFNSTLQYYNRTLPQGSVSLTSPNSSEPVDRNGDKLRYLLATGRAGAADPVTGAAYPSGAVDNGLLNWSNVDSFGTWLNNKVITTRYSEAEIDYNWTGWLTTQLNVGYADQGADKSNPGLSYYAPGAGGATDPINGIWNVGYTPVDSDNSSRTKGIRFSAYSEEKGLFGGSVTTRTIVGTDYIRSDSALVENDYFQADGNWNVIVNPAVTTFEGRTQMSKIYYPIDRGVNQSYYAFFAPRTEQVTVNGINYVRQVANPVNPSKIGPGDPVGADVLGGKNYSLGHIYNRGIYGVNNTDWFGGRLNSMLGFRTGESIDRVNNQGYAPPQLPHTQKLSKGNIASFNAGLNYRLTELIRPYAEFSDSFDPPLTQAQDPYGNDPPVAHGVGEEVGVKIANPAGTISGAIAFYHDQSKNEQYLVTSTLMDDINPSGLNGTYGARNQWVPTDRLSQGADLQLTAQPTPNWRMRFSAGFTEGKIQKTTTYAQVYNDQFNENSSGDVTYSDGTVVYVNGAATSSSKGAEVAAGAAGAVPLTVALMNSPSSPYYANPASVTGAINHGSAPGKIMLSPLFASSHGSILTGRVGLPISAAQIDTTANPNSAGYIAPPGTIAATVSGDSTTGYPEYAFNWTNVYTFSAGWLNGLRVGGTVSSAWKLREYYYYVNGVSLGGARTTFSFPNLTLFDGIVAYRRKFGRFTWDTQLNVYNMFNHYDILVLPDAINGWNHINSLTATWNAQPRRYSLTTSFEF